MNALAFAPTQVCEGIHEMDFAVDIGEEIRICRAHHVHLRQTTGADELQDRQRVALTRECNVVN